MVDITHRAVHVRKGELRQLTATVCLTPHAHHKTRRSGLLVSTPSGYTVKLAS